ncbi:unnamed protein product [Schistosoma mattheei]|uniref:Uncharacterized protein n=1 Tax=Schistosoma mattheei TaxID=31246 RepID=A0A3P8ITR8_9TREM|nr:unnamed protein product [Schistosoma mattheei]
MESVAYYNKFLFLQKLARLCLMPSFTFTRYIFSHDNFYG